MDDTPLVGSAGGDVVSILRSGPRGGFGVGSEDVIRGQLESSVPLLKEVVASCGEAIISTDAHGMVTTWNPAA